MFGRTRVPNITPFTNRDNLTYLEWLRWLSHAVSTNVDKLNDVINGLNELRDDTAADLQRIHLDLFRRLYEEFGSIREELFDLALNGRALNPTNGKVENISKVINDVYDNVRVHAMFDSELDYTLKTELTNNWTARYHDLEAHGHWCDDDCSCRRHTHDGTTPPPEPEPEPDPEPLPPDEVEPEPVPAPPKYPPNATLYRFAGSTHTLHSVDSETGALGDPTTVLNTIPPTSGTGHVHIAVQRPSVLTVGDSGSDPTTYAGTLSSPFIVMGGDHETYSYRVHENNGIYMATSRRMTVQTGFDSSKPTANPDARKLYSSPVVPFIAPANGPIPIRGGGARVRGTHPDYRVVWGSASLNGIPHDSHVMVWPHNPKNGEPGLYDGCELSNEKPPATVPLPPGFLIQAGQELVLNKHSVNPYQNRATADLTYGDSIVWGEGPYELRVYVDGVQVASSSRVKGAADTFTWSGEVAVGGKVELRVYLPEGAADVVINEETSFTMTEIKPPPIINEGLLLTPRVTTVDGKPLSTRTVTMKGTTATPGNAVGVLIGTAVGVAVGANVVTDRVGATFNVASITGAAKVRIGVAAVPGTLRQAYPTTVALKGDAWFDNIKWCGDVEAGKSYTIVGPNGAKHYVWGVYVMAPGATGNVTVSFNGTMQYINTI